MELIFATKNEETAFKFLKEIYQDYDMTRERAEPVLKLVREGQIRISDPMFYDGNIAVYPEEGCDVQCVQEILTKWTEDIENYKQVEGHR
jgi:hypothetical protein